MIRGAEGSTRTKFRGRSLALITAAFVGLAFVLPATLPAILRIDQLSESIAYRYFAVARFYEGLGQGVWLPQGFTVSVLQQPLYLLIDGVLGVPRDNLRLRLNLFGYATSGLIGLINFCIVAFAFLSSRFNFHDKLIVACVVLMPVWGTGMAGWYYASLPDYYHLNMVVVTAATVVFIWNFRSTTETLGLRHQVIMGLLVGLACANKISMLPIAIAALSPLILRPKDLRVKPLGWAAIAAVAIASFLLTLLIFFHFGLRRARVAVHHFGTFMENLSLEPNFFSLVPHYLTENGYAFFVVAFVFCSLLAVTNNRSCPEKSIPSIILPYGLFLAGTAYFWFVAKRPAGTTFFEAVNSLIGLSGMALVTLRGTYRQFGTTCFLGLFLVALVTTTTGFRQRHDSLLNLRSAGAAAWDIYDQTQRRKAPVVVIIPDNEYTWGDVYEVLLKGVSDFPTWSLSVGSTYLQALPSPVTYRSDYDLKMSPSLPYKDTETIVWYERTTLAPPPTKYLELAEAIAGRACERRQIYPDVSVSVCWPKT